MKQWGLDLEAAQGLGERLQSFWSRFHRQFQTRTHDTSGYGYHYLSGLLRMETKRNMANIARKSQQSDQNMQHFMSQSPWDGRGSIEQVQAEIQARPELQSGGMLLLDESADAKAGAKTVGTGRQYNGRLGKVDMSQVGVFLSFVKGPFWSWIDGDLYLPQHWFSNDYADARAAVGVPEERSFQTKVELGLAMVLGLKAKDFAFEGLACDSFYGQDDAFRDQLDGAGIEYMAAIPSDRRVYLSPPEIGLPKNKRGKKATQLRVLSPLSYRVSDLRHHRDTAWHTLTIRPTERGHLTADFAARRVWVVRQDLTVKEEWLVIRRDSTGKCSYSLSNAAPQASLEHLAQRKCCRYFIERCNQDAKSDLGWDELQATKFRAWQHHLTLTILAAWFIAETKLDWQRDHAHDPELLEHYQVDVLPNLSMANVRELLRAVLPLPQLSTEEAALLVVEHLDRRVRSRKSRLKRRNSRSRAET